MNDDDIEEGLVVAGETMTEVIWNLASKVCANDSEVFALFAALAYTASLRLNMSGDELASAIVNARNAATETNKSLN